MSYIGSTPISQNFISGTDYFNGDGSAVNFTLSRSVNSVNDIEVLVNNVAQIPSGYLVSGTTLTFSIAPSAGTSNVYVRYLSTTNLSLAIPSGTSAAFNTVTATSLTATTLAATNVSYTGTLTGNGGIVNIGSGQIYKDASGNVGIGTSSPASKLHVSGNARLGTGAWLGFPDSGGSLVRFSNGEFIATTGQQLQLCADNGDGVIAFCTTSTGSISNERARIDSSGATFLNCTASPTGNGTGAGGLNMLVTVGDGINLKSTNSGNNLLNLWSTGTSSNAAMLFLKGDAKATVGSIQMTTTTTSYVTSSDYRLKNTIAPMTGALDKVALLKPCTYKWNADGSDGQGFIAHELQEVEAGCVSGEKDAVDAEGKPQYQGIDTSFLVATLTAAIQELKAIIDTQATRITALEAK